MRSIHLGSAPQKFRFFRDLFSNLLPIRLIAMVIFAVLLACSFSGYDTLLAKAHTHYLQGRHEQAKQL